MIEEGLVNKLWIVNIGEEQSIVYFVETGHFPIGKRKFLCEDIRIYVPCIIKPQTRILTQIVFDEVAAYIYDERSKTLLILPSG